MLRDRTDDSRNFLTSMTSIGQRKDDCSITNYGQLNSHYRHISAFRVYEAIPFSFEDDDKDIWVLTCLPANLILLLHWKASACSARWEKGFASRNSFFRFYSLQWNWRRRGEGGWYIEMFIWIKREEGKKRKPLLVGTNKTKPSFALASSHQQRSDRN